MPERGEKVALGATWSRDGVGMGSGKCDKAAIASESAETSRTQECVLTAFLLDRTTDSDALESLAVHLLNFCPDQGPLDSFGTHGEFQYPSGFRASLQGLVTLETASGCRKYMHSALQIGPNDEILPWKSNNAHTGTRARTHTHTHVEWFPANLSETCSLDK